MSYQIDSKYLIDTLHELVEVDSPVGYYADIHAYLARRLEPRRA